MSKNSLPIIPPIIAHRGASAYAPENTRASFLKAKDLGAKWVEFDVQLTADRRVVVFHDDTLERTSNGRGRIESYTLDYLKTLDIGSWFNPVFSNEKILTLEEALLLLQDLKLSANIELKASLDQAPHLAVAVMEILQNYSDLSLLISSFSSAAIKAIRRIHSTVPLGYLIDEWTDEWQSICNELHCTSVNISEDITTQERISFIKQAGYAVMVYTVNDPLNAKKLFAWGVNTVFTDYIDVISNNS